MKLRHMNCVLAGLMTLLVITWPGAAMADKNKGDRGSGGDNPGRSAQRIESRRVEAPPAPKFESPRIERDRPQPRNIESAPKIESRSVERSAPRFIEPDRRSDRSSRSVEPREPKASKVEPPAPIRIEEPRRGQSASPRIVKVEPAPRDQNSRPDIRPERGPKAQPKVEPPRSPDGVKSRDDESRPSRIVHVEPQKSARPDKDRNPDRKGPDIEPPRAVRLEEPRRGESGSPRIVNVEPAPRAGVIEDATKNDLGPKSARGASLDDGRDRPAKLARIAPERDWKTGSGLVLEPARKRGDDKPQTAVIERHDSKREKGDSEDRDDRPVAAGQDDRNSRENRKPSKPLAISGTAGQGPEGASAAQEPAPSSSSLKQSSHDNHDHDHEHAKSSSKVAVEKHHHHHHKHVHGHGHGCSCSRCRPRSSFTLALYFGYRTCGWCGFHYYGSHSCWFSSVRYVHCGHCGIRYHHGHHHYCSPYVYVTCGLCGLRHIHGHYHYCAPRVVIRYVRCGDCGFSYHYGYSHTCYHSVSYVSCSHCHVWYDSGTTHVCRRYGYVRCSACGLSYRSTSRHVCTAAVVVASDPPAAPAAVAPAPLDGWAELRRDNFEEALKKFTETAEQYPDRGLPQVGRAVTLGMMGRDTEAIESMRLAVEMNPESLHYVPTDDHMKTILAHLSGEYRAQAETRQEQLAADLWFMVAALETSRRDDAAALLAIDKATTLGDDLPSTRALNQFIPRGDEKWKYPYEEGQ